MLDIEQIDYFLVNAYNAAVKAGAKIMEIYTQYDDFYVSLKSDSTPLTIADREAHTIIKHHLGPTRIPLLSEEGRDLFYEERRGWDLFWMVDPLDGTDEFIKRNGEFTVNIALIVDNRPALGVVYMPTGRTMYFADPVRGAYCKTGQELLIEPEYMIDEIFDGAKKLPLYKKLNKPVKVAMSRSHESEFVGEFIDFARERFGKIQIVEYGSSLKFCLVAEGTVDYYIRTTQTFEWDTAAGEAIAAHAGVNIVSMGEYEGEPLYYNKESLLNPPFICKSKYSPV